MDGQNGGYRPRTAGDRTGAPGSDSGVRDWQKHTWFGPAPLNSNPFDEPEDAPELRESRSENVTEHVGEFWRSPERGYSPQQQPRRYPDGKSRTTTEKKNTHSRMIRAAAIALVVITAVALVLRFAVFSVKEIRVSGNNLISAEEIIRQSGIPGFLLPEHRSQLCAFIKRLGQELVPVTEVLPLRAAKGPVVCEGAQANDHRVFS